MIDRRPTERQVYMSNSLGGLFETWKRQLSPDAFAETMQQVAKQFHVVQARLAKMKPGKDRAKWEHRFVQSLIDKGKADVAQDFEKKVTCSVGCAGCCHQRVEINSDEADLLAHLVQNGLKIDLEKLERQAGRVFAEKDLGWWRQPQEDKACIFLGHANRCRVYANRPLACRKYFTFTPPAKCSEVSDEGSITVGVYTLPDVEIAASAIIDFVRGEANIPQALWERLKGVSPKTQLPK